MRIPPLLQTRGIEAIVGLDFETYWDKDYTLKKLSTTEYVRDPRFKAQCVGWRMHSQNTPMWNQGYMIHKSLDFFDWSKTALLAHHAHFDGLILTHHFGHVPAFYLCTLSMARPLHGGEIRNDLDTLSRHYNGHGKSKDYLAGTKGVCDLSEELMQLLGEGCAQDVDEMWRIFERMLPHYPEEELLLIHHTVKAYVEPVLQVHEKTARVAHKLEMRRKRRLLKRVGLTDIVLRSRKQVATELEKLGVTPPMKVSPRTGEMTYAFAKDDLEFQALLEHRDSNVRDLVEARLAVSTSLEETRALRLLSHASPALPIYLNYGKAHTLRWSGGDRMNPQNFGRESLLRRAIMAPPGHKLVIADSAQIEARVNAWLAGEAELVEAFRDPTQDFYKQFAAESIFGSSVEEIDKTRRFVGKVCIAEDVPVLTNRGWVPIQDVALADLVWDGIEWTRHRGLIQQGTKEVWQAHLVGATPDHEILTERGWRAWSEVLIDPGTFQSALSSANLPSFGTSATSQKPVNPGATAQFANVLAGLNPLTMSALLKQAAQPAATNALSGKPTPSGFGSTETRCLTTSLAHDSLIDSPRASVAATNQPANITSTMANAASPFIPSGGTTARRFSAMFRRYLDGTTRTFRWIVSMLTGTTNQTTSGSSPVRQTYATSARSPTCSDGSPISKRRVPTYDLACAGPRNRFTIWSSRGALIVHNCILGLGYQMGSAKFAYTLESGKMGMAVALPEDMYAATVFAYRNRFSKIKEQWGTMQQMLAVMFEGREHVEYGPLTFEKGRVRLPNGMYLLYPQLEPGSVQRGVERNSSNGMFRSKPATTVYRDWTYNGESRIYGGLLTENCLAEGTPVLTNRGWLAIEQITKEDLVHDGVEFTRHEGVVAKTIQGCVEIDGVWMTPDHEVLTDEGWKPALEKPRPYRPDLRDVDSNEVGRFGREETALALPLRQGSGEEQTRIAKGRYSNAVQENGDIQVDTVLPTQTRLTFDIRDCGPRRRFVVAGRTAPFIVHNCVQALARCVVAEQILTIADKYRVVLLVHDEVVLCVPEHQAEQALADTLEAFHTPRPWCPDLPVAGEGKISDYYAKG